jgi:uncharacterized protein (TIRG00374 family)
MKAKVKVLLATLIAVILIIFLLSQIQLNELINTLASLNPSFLLFGFIFYSFSYLLRALRFYLLLNREISPKDLFNVVCVHNAMNNIMPARTGEIAYIYLLSKYHNRKVGEGLATLFIARMFDLISVSILFFLSILILGRVSGFVVIIINLFILFILTVGLFILFLLHGASFLNMAKKILRKYGIEERAPVSYLLSKGEEVVECMEKIRSGKRSFFFTLIFTSFGIWLSLYSMNYIIALSVGLEFGFFEVLFASTFAILTTILPIQGIGGFGTVEGGIGLGFLSIGLNKENAIILGFVYHLVYWVYFSVLGLFGFMSLKKR